MFSAPLLFNKTSPGRYVIYVTLKNRNYCNYRNTARKRHQKTSEKHQRSIRSLKSLKKASKKPQNTKTRISSLSADETGSPNSYIDIYIYIGCQKCCQISSTTSRNRDISKLANSSLQVEIVT